MDAKDIIKKVRTIEIKTKGLSTQIFSGEYHSAFKGRGMAFSEVREYNAGDEIRTIDWNVTARFDDPYVKVFEEERELSVMLLIDVSGSSSFGTKNILKSDYIAEVAAVIAFSAIENNDKIGVIFFSDKVEKYIPPKKGKMHVLRIIREMIDFKPENKGTDVENALNFLVNTVKKRAISFLISDLQTPEFGTSLKIAAKKHDLIALHIEDPAEYELPNVGLIKVKDPETGNVHWLDTSLKESRTYFKNENKIFLDQVLRSLKLSGVDAVTLKTDQPYTKPLMSFFKQRGARR